MGQTNFRKVSKVRVYVGKGTFTTNPCRGAREYKGLKPPRCGCFACLAKYKQVQKELINETPKTIKTLAPHNQTLPKVLRSRGGVSGCGELG